ncbi:MAG: isoprenylcysteine carboxylmethyltransferase family protein [candidate division NC10 bacterium]|nr:isoprenylcysteine carboxylmethyltransferase family protein [candidate division NC10 bacterium]
MKVILIYAGSICLFLLLIPGASVVGGYFLDRRLGSPSLPCRWICSLLGAVLLLVGLTFIKASWTNLLRIGKGHPQEAFGVALLPPTQKLVTDGPYAYTRNPMALGFFLHLLGILLIFRSLSALLLLYPLICILAVLYLKKIEEPHLTRQFGQEYLDYRERVSFLIPRVPD